MTPAVQSIIIFGICMILFVWNILPIDITALIGLSVMTVLGIVSFETGFRNFSSPTFVLICSMMVIGKAIYHTGLAHVIGEKVFVITKENERNLIILATIITALISAFFSNVATLSIMLSILSGICTNSKQIKFMDVAMPVSIAAVFGGSITLIGSTPQLTAQGLLEQYLGVGNGFKFYTFLFPGTLILLGLVIYVSVIGYPLGKMIWGNRSTYLSTPNDLSVVRENKNTAKIRTMTCIFLATISAFVFCDFIKIYIPTINTATISLISAIACVLFGCIDHKNALISINWSLVIWFAASLGMAGGLEASGGAKLLANCFIQSWKSEPNAFLVYSIFVIVAIFLTQFISNSTVLTIILPVVYEITFRMKLNTYPFFVGITLASAMAIVTPLANATIGMSLVAGYKFSDYYKYAGPITVFCTLLLLVIVPIIWPLE